MVTIHDPILNKKSSFCNPFFGGRKMMGAFNLVKYTTWAGCTIFCTMQKFLLCDIIQVNPNNLKQTILNNVRNNERNNERYSSK
jgi:hypothetical protein